MPERDDSSVFLHAATNTHHRQESKEKTFANLSALH